MSQIAVKSITLASHTAIGLFSNLGVSTTGTYQIRIDYAFTGQLAVVNSLSDTSGFEAARVSNTYPFVVKDSEVYVYNLTGTTVTFGVIIQDAVESSVPQISSVTSTFSY